MRSAALRVLTYHRVLDLADPSAPRPDGVSATPAVFDRQMRHVAARYRVVSSEEVLLALRSGQGLPRKAVLITFDDAYRDFGEVAWPILRRHRLPATVFVPTAFPDQPAREFWWDRLHRVVRDTSRRTLALPSGDRLPLDGVAARAGSLRALEAYLKSIPHADAMALVERACDRLGDDGPRAAPVHGWRELRALAADGVTLAAHTRTHPALTRLPDEAVRDEVRGARDDLRREVGEVTPIFAYPFGAHDERVVRIVREEGFELAVTCVDGHNRLAVTDPLRLRRTNVTTRTTPLILRARLHRLGAYVDAWRHRRERQALASPPRELQS
jgi:peptidoglycan/xylan/chitin deacetylase (PgdA/CDA1 family)